MGLSFHYHGQLANAGRLPELIEEVKEVALVYHPKLGMETLPKNAPKVQRLMEIVWKQQK
jgi:hypothetical protein